LRKRFAKCQEEKRSLELQLVTEKALCEQEVKYGSSELEKHHVQFNAQIYAMKCEVETWKRKAEGGLKESALLKEQLQSVEVLIFFLITY